MDADGNNNSNNAASSAAAAAVTTRPWCCVCRRSSDTKWSKHAYARSHQQCAREFLDERTDALTDTLAQLDPASNCTGASAAQTLATLVAHKWSCSFCELYRCVSVLALILMSLPSLELTQCCDWRVRWCISAADWRTCIDHFASDAHRKALDAFCKLHRCDVDRSARAKLQLSSAQHRKVQALLDTR